MSHKGDTPNRSDSPSPGHPRNKQNDGIGRREEGLRGHLDGTAVEGSRASGGGGRDFDDENEVPTDLTPNLGNRISREGSRGVVESSPKNNRSSINSLDARSGRGGLHYTSGGISDNVDGLPQLPSASASQGRPRGSWTVGDEGIRSRLSVASGSRASGSSLGGGSSDSGSVPFPAFRMSGTAGASGGSNIGGGGGGAVGGSDGGLIDGGASEDEATVNSDYGCTPLAMRRGRFARADLGDYGREVLMQEHDIRRLHEMPREVVDDDLDLVFTEFFDNFKVLDFFTAAELSEEDKAIVEMAEAQSAMEMGSSTYQAVQTNSHYYFKLIKYIECATAHAHGQGSGRKTGGDDSLFDDQSLARKYKDTKELYGCFDNIDGGSDDSLQLNSLQYAPRLRFYEKPNRKMDSPRTLEPRNIDTLVCIRGIIIRCSELIPELTMGAFRCTGYVATGVNETQPCTEVVYETVVNGEILEPRTCRKCGSRNSFEVWHNSCLFASKQLVKISEVSEDISPGDTPQTLTAYLYDEMIEQCKPGDRVEVTGVYKASGVRLNPRFRNQGAVFRTFLNILHVRLDERSRVRMSRKLGQGRGAFMRGTDGRNDRSSASGDAGNLGEMNFGVDEDENQQTLIDLDLSEEVQRTILELSKKENIYDLLIGSIAPSIYGREDVKKGLLCQLLGGTKRKISNNYGGNEHGNFRSEIHLLLCGDPATAKSQLLNYVHKLAPRGVCTSGKGSSQVGLTAFVTRDPETKEFILESGAVVLSDRGICCIDEFDKMDDGARAVLHEVMEQQTVTVAKAGIVATLNARTAILASANPVNSRYDRHRAVVDNINMPASLFSRFDLIYLVLDSFDEKEDRRLAEALCDIFSGADEDKKASIKTTIPRELMAQYISFARASCHPILSIPARDTLVREYLKMRHHNRDDDGDEGARAHRLGGDDGGPSQPPTATPRQLEALIRISQALAKVRLANEVTKSDAEEAVRLMNVATYKSLVDPISGRIDFDQMTLGQTLQQRKALQRLSTLIQSVLQSSTTAMTQDEILVAVRDRSSGSDASQQPPSQSASASFRQPQYTSENVPTSQLLEALASLEKSQVIVRKPGSNTFSLNESNI